MMPVARKKILLLCRRAPYAGHLAQAALDAALAAAVFEQDLTLLFMDEGIWQLSSDQHGAAIERKSIASTLDSMPLYDIESFYVDAESLRLRDVDAESLGGNTLLLGATELPGFLDSFDQVWSF